MTYATIAQARAAGAPATASDDQVADALLDAADLVDQFAGRFFGEQTRSCILGVSPAGVAHLVTPVTGHDPDNLLSVATEDGQSIPDALWRYEAPLTGSFGAGAIRVGADAGYDHDMLVLGAEPWNGGWAGLYGRRYGEHGIRRVLVTGTFGEARVPTAVQTATAAIAATLLGGSTTVAASAPLAGVESISEEGYAVKFSSPAPPIVGRSIRSTGCPAADVLLAPYVIEGRWTVA